MFLPSVHVWYNCISTHGRVLNSICLPDGESLAEDKYTVLVNKMPERVRNSDNFFYGGRMKIEQCFCTR